MSETSVTLEDVRVTLGGYAALRGVSVDFSAGQSTVIVGPSGCGKSTLLKTAAGIIPPDSGRVLVDGRDLFQLSDRSMLELRRHGGFVFQDGALWENMTVAENLSLPLRVHFPGLTQTEVTRRVIRTLERAGMEESATERPAALSGGEKKIASFLRALIVEPSLLYLDEPTLSIDHAMAERINQMIRDLKARGCTIIAVTHDASLTTTLADNLVVMDAGQVIERGTFDVVKRTRNPRARSILSEIIKDIAAYDTDLLDLIGGLGDGGVGSSN
jgi:phospholipid/cholesterol/gamma-HCH transport system ATP-binding protein